LIKHFSKNHIKNTFFLFFCDSSINTPINQNFESINSIPFAGKTVTMSYYARAGANFSSSSNILGTQLVSGTGTDQTLFTNYTGAANVISQNATLTTTWQRFSYTFSMPSLTGKTIGAGSFVDIGIGMPASAFTIDFWGLQVEASNTATAFQTATGTLQGELAACMRYYEKTYIQGVAPATNTSEGLYINYGSSESIGNIVATIPMQVAKRNVSYSVAVYTSSGTVSNWSYSRSGAAANTAITIDLKSERTFRAFGAVGANWVVATINGHWVVDNEL
jgi:hypothetical protein